ncbi:MAG: hypothetical protein Q8R76_09595 [Candidatus Omnitrophota bacterium]|nr:hypothetical protein [Candidatus Omnitrophota bacterium]
MTFRSRARVFLFVTVLGALPGFTAWAHGGHEECHENLAHHIEIHVTREPAKHERGTIIEMLPALKTLQKTVSL